ncbi:trefoil factor 2-like [Pipra filicauda]|uniref:Trefoil factor 2-like n=1 Tax=Pipra filicauda TaxID=649802 RepID=A0A6J2ID38_9PASS|nr:trefoil factor 2-like [Pipra filicauda]
MDLKVVCVLSATLVIALSTLAEGNAPPTKCQCKMLPKERKNCGYPGISAAECKKMGCCFNSSNPNVPWCFTPKQKKVKKVCPSDPYARINCGHPGITSKECTKKGCCFRARPAGVPWCFYHRVTEEGETSIKNFPNCGSTSMEQETEVPAQTLYFATDVISRLFLPGIDSFWM